MNIDLNKNELESDNRLEITDNMKENLLIATKWIKFMNVLGCVSIGILTFCGLMIFFWGIMDSYSNGEKVYIGLLYVAMCAIYYPVLKKVFAFVKQARNSCLHNSNEELEGMFDSLRYIAKYNGIICAVFLCLYVFAIIIGVLVAIYN